MNISLPFNMTEAELQTDRNASNIPIQVNLAWLAAEVRTEEECEAIMRGAVVLYHKWEGALPFSQCLDTAIIWSRG